MNSPKAKFIRLTCLLSIVFMYLVSDCYSQNSLDLFIKQAREKNKSLQTARQLYEAQVWEAKSQNSPDNPEVEYAYLWGDPSQIGDRVDFSVTQSFDFPTAYSSRSRFSRMKREQAGLQLQAAEQNLVVLVRQAWIQAVYLNNKAKLIRKRLSNTEMIYDAYQRMYEEGEANQLQLNQAALKVTALNNELNRLQLKRISLEARISQLNGGESFQIADTLFPTVQEINLDTLLSNYQVGAMNQMKQSEVSLAAQKKDVIFNQKLPKLKAGYYQETILGTKMQGIKAGITIPLWENAHHVKSAKAEMVYAQTDAERYWESQNLAVKQMFGQWNMLRQQVSDIRSLLDHSNNDELLLKALESGEISITQYYYESDFYFDNKFELLDFQLELYLLESELLRTTF